MVLNYLHTTQIHTQSSAYLISRGGFGPSVVSTNARMAATFVREEEVEVRGV